MGYNRAGFYGYDIIGNVGSTQGVQSADHILPAFHQPKVGDNLPLSAVAGLVFYAVQPNDYLIWSDKNQKGSFLWALYPVDKNSTTLISRTRWSHHTLQEPGMLAMDVFTELTDYLAVRKVLQGVKQRVEGNIEPWIIQIEEFGIYFTAMLIFLIALVLLLMRTITCQRWLSGLGAAAWLITWYAPSYAWFGIILILLVCWS